jgi:hypothetical protein
MEKVMNDVMLTIDVNHRLFYINKLHLKLVAQIQPMDLVSNKHSR